MNELLESLHLKANRCKTASLVSFTVLISLYLLQFLWVAPNAHLTDNSAQWILLSVYIVPLLLFAPGLKAGKARTYAWFCFMLMIYFCDSVVTAFAIPHVLGYLGVAESLTICFLFTTAMYATKWYGLIDNNGVSNRKKKNQEEPNT